MSKEIQVKDIFTLVRQRMSIFFYHLSQATKSLNFCYHINKKKSHPRIITLTMVKIYIDFILHLKMCGLYIRCFLVS